MKKPVLCFVEDQWAYFTTQKLANQTGDGWHKAPYEHNSETPYEYNEHDKAAGKKKWKITKVAFESHHVPPCDSLTNSPYSVNSMNSGNVPWLSARTWYLTDIPWPKPIFAGTTLSDFIKIIKSAGGRVYLEKS